MGTRRRIVLPLAALLLLTAASCGEDQHGATAASCAAAVEWHGTTYFGTNVPGAVKVGQPLGEGTVPGCQDGGGPADDQKVELSAIDGVALEQAVAVDGDRSAVYVAPGYFTQVPHTPLHDLLFGTTEAKPDERGSCEPGNTTNASVRAVVRGANFGALSVTLLDTALPRRNWIFSDARTVIEGGGTTPKVSTGDIVRARVLVCRHAADSHFLKLVATRLTLPGSE